MQLTPLFSLFHILSLPLGFLSNLSSLQSNSLVIHHLFTISYRSPSFIAHRSLLIAHRSSFIVHRSSFLISFVLHRNSSISEYQQTRAHHALIVRRSSFPVHHTSLFVTCLSSLNLFSSFNNMSFKI